jgi:6-phosphogluconolactonase (cycloisomerase 2 family)
VYLVSVADGRAALTKLPLEALPEWSDLGAGGWAHPTKPWLYIGSKYSQRIHAFAVDEATGAVQPIVGSPFLVDPLPSGGELSVPALIMDPSGKFLYLARDSFTGSTSSYLAAFAIDPATGALSAIETYSP